MKCPKCGSETVDGPPSALCLECGETIATAPCQHEPANFCANGPDNFRAITYPYLVPDAIAHTPPMRFLVCRLCGVFYTDLDTVIAGEKKYHEAQRSE